MKLLIVILNYKVTDLTLDCLRSLEGRVDRVPGTRVTVVENGTGGDAVERLRAAIDGNGWSRWAELMPVHPNRGFTGGNNIAIRPALESADPPEYVLLLNADTLVQDGALEALVDFMDRTPRAGIAGSKLVWPDGKAQGSPFRFLGISTELDVGSHLAMVSRLVGTTSVAPKPTRETRVDWVGGTSMILRRTMLDQVGLLDEGLYTYFDDVDICLRAFRAGWETWFVPDSVVTHLEGRSTGIAGTELKRRPDYWFQARRRFYLKSYGPLYTAIADATFILSYAAYQLRRRLQRRPDGDPPQFLRDFVRNSVFVAGFQVPEVENPAMRPATGAPR